jgi:membrane protease YdiL (CAAX protease family)
MPTIRGFIRSHPLLSYYALTFAISWGAIAWVILSGGIPATKDQMDAVLPVAIVAMLAGPGIAGLLMIGLVDGRTGFRDLGSRLGRWRVGARWYPIAVLLVPLVLLAGFMALSLFSPVYRPGIFETDAKTSRLMLGIVAGLAVGICEELGWTGFVTPKLRRRHGILVTGIIVGVLWGAWHIAAHVVLASGAYSAPLSPAQYIVARGLGFVVGGLVAIRVLMVWVYDRTGSLLVATLMHWSHTASAIILEPVAIAGVPLLISDVASTAAMWAVVAAVAAANGGRLKRDGTDRAN